MFGGEAGSSSGGDWPLIPENEDNFGSMAQTHFDRVIFENNLMSVDAGISKLPWKKGVFAQIFGGGGLLGLPVDAGMIPQPAFPVARSRMLRKRMEILDQFGPVRTPQCLPSM